MTLLWWYVTILQSVLAGMAFHKHVLADEDVVGRYIGVVVWVLAVVPLLALLWLVRP